MPYLQNQEKDLWPQKRPEDSAVNMAINQIIDACRLAALRDRQRMAERVGLEEIEQAIARGYCTKRNGQKVMDADLIQDMALEVHSLFMGAVRGEGKCQR